MIETLGALTALVYDTVLEPQLRPDALRAIGARLGGAGAILAVHPCTGGVDWTVLAGLDPHRCRRFDRRHQPLPEGVPRDSARRAYIGGDFHRARGVRRERILELPREVPHWLGSCFSGRLGPFWCSRVTTFRTAIRMPRSRIDNGPARHWYTVEDAETSPSLSPLIWKDVIRCGWGRVLKVAQRIKRSASTHTVRFGVKSSKSRCSFC